MDEKPVSESDATSREPGSCRETGEESGGKHLFPLGAKVEHLPREAQHLLTLRAAELLRRHGAEEPVAGRSGVSLLEQLAAGGRRGGLHSQPAQHAPDGTVVQGSFFNGRRLRLIADHSFSGAGSLTVGLAVVLQVAAGTVQEGPAGVTFIGEYESRDNR